MDEKTITGQVHSSMYSQLQSRGYAAPVDVLMDAGVLSKEGYESWRLGKVDFLERVCKVNLRKLSEIMKTIRAYAKKNELKASWTFYGQYACKTKRKLRFSKSGSESIEKEYATHYLYKDENND